MFRVAPFGLCAAFALFMVACGDDSSSSPANGDEEMSSEAETDVSSSSKKASSSSKKLSSSSKKVSSSSKGISSSGKATSSSSKKVSSSSKAESSNSKASSSSKGQSSSSKGKDGESSSSAKINSSSSVVSSSSQMDALELELGVCDSSIADSLAQYKQSHDFYICKNNKWEEVTEQIVYDTYKWPAGDDGDAKKGNVDTYLCYVFDKTEGNVWRLGNMEDCSLGLGGCTMLRTDTLLKGSDSDLYKCDGTNKKWKAASDTDILLGKGCSKTSEGNVVLHDTTYYACRYNGWKKATAFEVETYEQECSAKDVGKTLKGSIFGDEYYCGESGWLSVTRWSWEYPVEKRLNPNITYETMVDSRDKQSYRIVKIGDQTWMAQNLNYADSSLTPSLKGRSWCYENEPENCKVAGRYYTWAAAIDSIALASAKNSKECGYGKQCSFDFSVRGICPPGWHLPNNAEWEKLFEAVGGADKASTILKSQTGWEGHNGTDEVGFCALPTNGTNPEDGRFYIAGYRADLWSSDEYNLNEVKGTRAYIIAIHDYSSSGVPLETTEKRAGLPVRCLKD